MAETTRRPWYAVALVAGFGGVLAVMLALGLAGAPARGQEPRIARSGIVEQPQLPPGSISVDERLSRIEKAIEGLQRAWEQLPERCRKGGER